MWTALIASLFITTALGAYTAWKSAQAQKEANETNIQLQEQANQLAIDEAQKNRDWQTEMANTAHQREMADLQAAGLNPLLAAGNSGAATGSVVQPFTSSTKVNAVMPDLSALNNVITSVTNMMLTQKLINSSKLTDAKIQMAHAAQDRANAALAQAPSAAFRNSSLSDYYDALTEQVKYHTAKERAYHNAGYIDSRYMRNMRK